MAAINPEAEGQELAELAEQAAETPFGSPEHEALAAKVRELVTGDEDHNRLILVTLAVLQKFGALEAAGLIHWYAEAVAGEADVTLHVDGGVVHGTAQTFLCPIVLYTPEPPPHLPNETLTDLIAGLHDFDLVPEDCAIVFDSRLYAPDELPETWGARRTHLLTFLANHQAASWDSTSHPTLSGTTDNDTAHLRFLIGITMPADAESDAAWNIEEDWPETALEDGRLDGWREWGDLMDLPLSGDEFASLCIPGRWMDALIDVANDWNPTLIAGMVEQYFYWEMEASPGTFRAIIEWQANTGWHCELRATKSARRARGLWYCPDPEDRWSQLGRLLEVLDDVGVHRYDVKNHPT